MDSLTKARLIPVTGIDTEREAEGRATSALLAVLSVVRDLSTLVFAPMGASKAQTATVETYTEPRFKSKDKNVRPDGLVRVTYGKKTWAAVVEVKTGTASLSADQVNLYWDLARAEKLDAVVTITNDIAPAPGVHPVEGLRVQSNSPVQVFHVSWTHLLTTAVALKQHKGVSDPEQAWILDELIRYLEHPASGALQFDDMGPNWVSVRSDARVDRLTAKDDAPSDIAQRWDQLLRFIALTLGAEIGEDVQQVIPRKHVKNPKLRHEQLVTMLCEAAAAIPGDQSADDELIVTLDACDSYRQWVDTLRAHPAALGLNSRAEILGPMEVSNICYGSTGQVCDDARQLGVLTE